MKTGKLIGWMCGALVSLWIVACGSSSDGTTQDATVVNPLPSATALMLTTPHDHALVVQLQGVDPEGDALTFVIDQGPAKGSLGPLIDGVVTYTPPPAFAGTDRFFYRVSDGVSDSAETPVTIEVTNQAPMAQNVADVVTKRNVGIRIRLLATDPDADALSFRVLTAPLHGTVGSVVGDTVAYQPDADFLGEDTFTYVASDRITDSAAATVTVRVGNTEPEVPNLSVTTLRNTPVVVVLSATDADADATRITLLDGPADGPAFGTVSISPDNRVTYTPNIDYLGPDHFRYRASDGAASSAVGAVSVSVVNQAPTAVDVLDVPVQRGGSVTIRLPATDPEGDALSFEVIGLPSHGLVGQVAGDRVTYRPDSAYLGSDAFTFRASDGHGQGNVARVSVNVFTTGPEVASSTIQASGPVVADDVATAQVTLVLRDAAGLPVAGVVPVLAVSGSNNTLVQAGPTDAAGRAVASIRSSKAEEKTVYVASPAGFSGLSTTVEFVAGPPVAGNARLSTFYPDAAIDSAIADTKQAVRINVLLRDRFQNPVVGVVPRIDASGAGNLFVQPGATDAVGRAEGLLRSSRAEAKTVALSAPEGLDGVSVPVLFVAGPPSPVHSALMIGAPVVADGEAVISATLVIRDAWDNPVPGLTPTLVLQENDRGFEILDAGPSDLDGVSHGGIRSTTAGTRVLGVAVPTELAGLTANVTFVPGAASPSHSTLVATDNVRADAMDRCLVTITLRDRFDNPVIGVFPRLDAPLSTGNTFVQPGMTDFDGVARGALMSTRAEVKRIDVVAPTGLLELSKLVTFVPGVASARWSRLVVATPEVVGGVQTARVTIVLRDAQGNPIPGVSVSLAMSGDEGTILQPASPTDVDGVTAGMVSTSVPGTRTIRIVAPAGLGMLDSEVTFDPVPPVVTDLMITPDFAEVEIGGLLAFSAVAMDGMGNIVDATPVWKVVGGGGSIVPGGLFMAGAVGDFPGTIEAVVGDVKAHASVRVRRILPVVTRVEVPEGDVLSGCLEVAIDAIEQDGRPVDLKVEYSLDPALPEADRVYFPATPQTGFGNLTGLIPPVRREFVWNARMDLGPTGGTPLPVILRVSAALDGEYGIPLWSRTFEVTTDGPEGQCAFVLQSTGDQATCRIREDGTLWCWGYDCAGRMGQGNYPWDNCWGRTPIKVKNSDGGPGWSDWISVSVGGVYNSQNHTCGIRADRSLWCWGYGSNGELGVSTYSLYEGAKSLPTRVLSDGLWKHVAAGNYFTCGIQVDGSAWCWGQHYSGQLGNGRTSGNYQYSPARVSSDEPWRIVTTGNNHACGIQENGTLWCWGDNNYGKLGNGTSYMSALPVRVGEASDWVAVSAGADHTCGVRGTGTLYCWGSNGEGRLGDGTTEQRMTPVRAGSVDDWVGVATGNYHTCGLHADGMLSCWGNNGNGQLGIGSMESSFVMPVPVPGGRTWDAVDAGGTGTCATDIEGDIWCWGGNWYHQAGRPGVAYHQPSPFPIYLDSTLTVMAAGSYHSCAIDDAQDVWCWGTASSGQLGLGPDMTNDQPLPRYVASDYAKLGLGENHSCGIATNGMMSCWGANGNGQLGVGYSGSDLRSPNPVTGGRVWLAVDGGGSFTCGIDGLSKMFCWGSDGNGQLGNGGNGSSSAPVEVVASPNSGWTQVSAGREHACGLKGDKSLWCWGYNGNGQLGDMSYQSRDVPTQVSGAHRDWVSVATGSNFSCGVRSAAGEDTLWCWGDNGNAQLGLGYQDGPEWAPRRVVTANTDWVAVNAGEYFACAVRATGDAYCWGHNGYSQIGTGLTNNEMYYAVVPMPVARNVAWASFSLGNYHACALDAEGIGHCWGGYYPSAGALESTRVPLKVYY